MDELIEEKMKVVLNLIRTNNSADDALKITQAVDNLTRAKCSLLGWKANSPRKTASKGTS